MPASADRWRDDLLADLLRSVRVGRSDYYRPHFRAPWGVRVIGAGASFHAVLSGRCWLRTDLPARLVELAAGDLVILPGGDPHVLSDSPAPRVVVDVFELRKRHPPDIRGVMCAGGNGGSTELVCGRMQFEKGAAATLLAVLPSVIHVRTTSEGLPQHIRATIQHVQTELNSAAACDATIVDRLSDILFIQAVRAYFEQNADVVESGWLAGVADRQIGPALALLHHELHRPWTVATLARRLSLSRSAFAVRFTSLIGEAPLHYLTRVRIGAACERLRSAEDTVSTIALSVGYESASALHRAFRRTLGITPGEYRRAYRRVTPVRTGGGDAGLTDVGQGGLGGEERPQ